MERYIKGFSPFYPNRFNWYRNRSCLTCVSVPLLMKSRYSYACIRPSRGCAYHNPDSPMKLPRRRFFRSLLSLGAFFSANPLLDIDRSASDTFKRMLHNYLAETPPERQNQNHIRFLKDSILGWQDIEIARAKAMR